MKKKKKKHCRCKFQDFKLPPCAEFLGNYNPLVYNGHVIYRNTNRLYFFLCFNNNGDIGKTYNPAEPLTFNNIHGGCIQIEPYLFFIGVYINEFQKGNMANFNETKIHDDNNADEFIKSVLSNTYDTNNVNSEVVPTLSYVISNSNAILPLFSAYIEIRPINYYIILMLSRFYGDYGLLFGDNSYVTNDFVNETLASIFFQCK